MWGGASLKEDNASLLEEEAGAPTEAGEAPGHNTEDTSSCGDGNSAKDLASSSLQPPPQLSTEVVSPGIPRPLPCLGTQWVPNADKNLSVLSTHHDVEASSR